MDITPFRLVIGEELTLAGHVDVGSYGRLFDMATDHFRQEVGLGRAYAAAHNRGMFVVESHIVYAGEAKGGDEVVIDSFAAGFDCKKLHLLHVARLAAGGRLALCEFMIVHVDRSIGRSQEFDADTIESLNQARAKHPVPDDIQIGRSIRPLGQPAV